MDEQLQLTENYNMNLRIRVPISDNLGQYKHK